MRRGFTLIELLVVISIIALLIAILLPLLSSAKQATHRAQCASNLHQVSVAWTGYAVDNDGYWLENKTPQPWYWTQRSGFGSGWIDNREVINDYLQTSEIMYCPASQGMFGVVDKDSTGNANNKGWDAFPIGVPANIYAVSTYAIPTGFVSIAGGTSQLETWRYFSMRDEVYDPPDGALNITKLSKTVDQNEHAPADTPLGGDIVVSLYPSSLTALMTDPDFDHPFSVTGNSGAYTTNHREGGFQGLNMGMRDGSVQWRTPDVVAPRLFSYNIPPYGIVLWY